MTDNDAPTPAPDLRRLERLVGTWKQSDPTGNDGIDGTTTFDRMEGGFFLIQHVNLVQGDSTTKGIEIIGHELLFGETEPSADIKSRYYGNKGETFDYVYELEGDTLTIWGGEKGSPAYYRGTFSDDDNTLTGGWVWPGGGYDAKSTRVPPG